MSGEPPLPRLLAGAFKAARAGAAPLEVHGVHAGQDYLLDVLVNVVGTGFTATPQNRDGFPAELFAKRARSSPRAGSRRPRTWRAWSCSWARTPTGA